MRRLLISLLAIATFLSCNNDDSNGENGLESDNIVLGALSSVESWLEYETFRYTEPNGEGDIVTHIDPNKPLLGYSYDRITIANGILTRYIHVNANPSCYYKEYVMKQVGDDSMHYKLVTSDGEFDFKILEYDSNNLKVEHNYFHGYRKDEVSGEYVKNYLYSITHFKKSIPSNSKWKDEYMSEKEHIEKYGK